MDRKGMIKIIALMKGRGSEAINNVSGALKRVLLKYLSDRRLHVILTGLKAFESHC